MKKLLILIIFLNSINGICQEKNEIIIEGIIFSEVNGKPLESAFITYKSRYRYSTTNEKGKFEYVYKIRKKDTIERIEISALGYENIDTIINVTKSKKYEFKFIMKPRFGINREKALEDIKNGKINILISSGIAPVIYKSDEKFSKKYQRSVKSISYGAEQAMLDYHWPGNVREMSHLVERAVLLAEHEQLLTEDLHIKNVSNATSTEPAVNNDNLCNERGDELPLMTLAEAEVAMVKLALAKAAGNVPKAAILLGLTKASMYRRVEKYGLAKN